MIKVTRLDGTSLVINSDLVETIEAIPETMICLTTGKKIMVKEAVDEVIEEVASFRRRFYSGPTVDNLESEQQDA